MVDSGAQVSCLPYSIIQAFPAFSPYYLACPDVVQWVGGVEFQVCGELKDVPLSLGEDQAAGSVVKCTFRVLAAERQYQIIFGLDFLIPLGAKLYLKERKMTYWRGPSGAPKTEATLKLYRRNTVQVQPAAREYRRFLQSHVPPPVSAPKPTVGAMQLTLTWDTL